MKSEDDEPGEVTTLSLVAALKKLTTEVKGCRSDVQELRGAVREMFEQLLREAIVTQRQGEDIEALKAGLTLLEQRVTVLERGAEAKSPNGAGPGPDPVQ